MALIRGKDVHVYIYDGGQWKEVVCAKTCSYRITRELIETSIEGSGPARTYVKGGITSEGSLDGVTFLQGTNSIAYPDAVDFLLAGEPILFRHIRTDTAGNVFTSELNAIIYDASDTGDQGGMNDFSIQFKGSGLPVSIFTTTPIDPSAKMKRLDYEGTGGEIYFSDSLLIGKSIIEVVKDGQGRSAILTAGTPLNQEVKYTSASGRFDFPAGQEFYAGENAYVLYQEM